MGFKTKSGKATGPACYSQFCACCCCLPQITVNGLTHINSVDDVQSVWISGGYVGEAKSVSGNKVKVKVYYGDYTNCADGVLAELAACADLSCETIHVVTEGY